jgi:hypothetical protein
MARYLGNALIVNPELGSVADYAMRLPANSFFSIGMHVS